MIMKNDDFISNEIRNEINKIQKDMKETGSSSYTTFLTLTNNLLLSNIEIDFSLLRNFEDVLANTEDLMIKQSILKIFHDLKYRMTNTKLLEIFFIEEKLQKYVLGFLENIVTSSTKLQKNTVDLLNKLIESEESVSFFNIIFSNLVGGDKK